MWEGRHRRINLIVVPWRYPHEPSCIMCDSQGLICLPGILVQAGPQTTRSLKLNSHTGIQDKFQKPAYSKPGHPLLHHQRQVKEALLSAQST